MEKEAEVAVAKKVDLHQLHLATHQKINFAANKNSLSEKEVYLIAKEFFKDLLELNYEFTHEELIEELRKTYLDKESFAKLENFILLIGQMEYSKKQFDQEELKVMLEEMKDIVDHLIQHHQRKRTFIEKMLSVLNPKHKGENNYETSALEKLEGEIVAEEEVVDGELIESLHKLIKEATSQKDANKAKTIFLEVKKMYNVLSPAEKKNIYPELVKAAEEVKQIVNIGTSTTETKKPIEKETPVENKEEQELPKEELSHEDSAESERELEENLQETTDETIPEKPQEVEKPIEKEEPQEPLFEESEDKEEDDNKDSVWANDHEEILSEPKTEESPFAISDEDKLDAAEKEENEEETEDETEDFSELIPDEKPVKKKSTQKKSSTKKITKSQTSKKEKKSKAKPTSKKIVQKEKAQVKKSQPVNKKTPTKKTSTKTKSKKTNSKKTSKKTTTKKKK